MSGEKKAIELQRQVRQNAQEYQNSVKDLYTWEKEIKSKEEALKKAPAPDVRSNVAPVRSHVTKAGETTKKPATNKKVEECGPSSNVSSAASTPTEKQDLPQDPLAQQHKRANDIKDRGNSYVKQADYEKAIEAYTEAIEVYPNDPIYFINRALCHIKLEQYVDCVDDCEAAIALDKLCVKAYYRRMQANESLGNNMEALKDCTTVLTIDPKNMEAKSSLGRINDRLRKIATKDGPSFTAARDDLIDLLPFDKPAYKRSKKSMRRVPVVDIVSPNPNQAGTQPLDISDDDLEKLFNSNCGPFEEKKKETVSKSVAKPIVLDTDKTESKQAATQSKVIETSKKSSENLAKATPKELKSEDSNKQKKPVEKPVTQVPQKSATNKDSEKNKQKNPVEKPLTQVPQKSATNKDTEKVASAQKTVEKKESTKETEAQNKPTSTTSMEPVPAAPTGTAQFYMTWKELSPNQKYHYLKSIEIGSLCKILGAGFDSDTFSDLLRTLKDFYVPNKEPTTAAVMLEISKNDEFPILAMLISQEEKKMIIDILYAIKQLPKINPGLIDKLFKIYNVA